MRVLSLETSGMSGSVAALDDLQVLLEVELDPVRRTAQTLVPSIAELLRQVGWQPEQVELITVTAGPGSFTGLRIGVTTAKTFSYATGAKLVGLNTLAAIANGVPANDRHLWCVMNAEREQLFAASFLCKEGLWIESKPTQIMGNAAWLAGLMPHDQVTGPGLRNLRDQIGPEVAVLEESLWTPRASAVGQLGLRLFREGCDSNWWSLLPNYFRESAATEKARGTAGAPAHQ